MKQVASKPQRTPIGEAIVTLIIEGRHIRPLKPGERVNEGCPLLAHQEAEGGVVFVWSANVCEQIEALVADYIRSGDAPATKGDD